jgi:NADH:ubiquinone oxidoreductase subunit K
MAENMEVVQDNTTPPALPAPSSPDTSGDRRKTMYILIAVVVVIVAALITGIIVLARSGPGVTGQVRDIFIIVMALESLVIGAALVILIVQLAILINLLQNEIRPIIHSTNETVNTLRGTATFLSDNLAEPIIKLNEYLAALRKLLDLLRPGR